MKTIINDKKAKQSKKHILIRNMHEECSFQTEAMSIVLPIARRDTCMQANIMSECMYGYVLVINYNYVTYFRHYNTRGIHYKQPRAKNLHYRNCLDLPKLVDI